LQRGGIHEIAGGEETAERMRREFKVKKQQKIQQFLTKIVR
jgi:hypothetical protein